MAKGYKTIGVYQSAHRLAVEVHRMTLEELPKFEMYTRRRVKLRF
jgi:hypothetical protein